MKKITKAVFGCWRPDGLNLPCMSAFAENGFCCATEQYVFEISKGASINEAHY